MSEPCHVCGKSPAARAEFPDLHPARFRLECPECDNFGPWDESLPEAIASWNNGVRVCPRCARAEEGGGT